MGADGPAEPRPRIPMRRSEGWKLRCGRLAIAVEAAWHPVMDLPGREVERGLCGALRLLNVPAQRALRWAAQRRKASYVRHLATSISSEYWGGAPGQERGMQRVLDALQGLVEASKSVNSRDAASAEHTSLGAWPPLPRLAVLDVGAASYEGPDRCHAADFAVLFGLCRSSGKTRRAHTSVKTLQIEVHAFEPLSSELERTRRLSDRELRRRLGLSKKAAAACIHWHQVAVSNVSGRLVRMRGRENQASISPHIPTTSTSSDYTSRPDLMDTVATIRLDSFSSQHGIDKILLLKIDTEGHDFEVLQGAHQLLKAQQVAVIVFEVAGQMNSDFFRIHKEGQRVPKGLGHESLAEPNLRSLAAWLDAVGYDSFLLGSRALVPLSGAFWDPSYEVCFTRPQLPCWYDAVAVARGWDSESPHSEAPLLREALLSAWERAW